VVDHTPNLGEWAAWAQIFEALPVYAHVVMTSGDQILHDDQTGGGKWFMWFNPPSIMGRDPLPQNLFGLLPIAMPFEL